MRSGGGEAGQEVQQLGSFQRTTGLLITRTYVAFTKLSDRRRRSNSAYWYRQGGGEAGQIGSPTPRLPTAGCRGTKRSAV